MRVSKEPQIYKLIVGMMVFDRFITDILIVLKVEVRDVTDNYVIALIVDFKDIMGFGKRIVGEVFVGKRRDRAIRYVHLQQGIEVTIFDVN